MRLGEMRPNPGNRGVGKNSAQLFFTEPSQFLSQNWLPWQQGSSGEKFK